MTQFLTLSRKNLFSFTCPIFNAKVEMRGCVRLRDIVYSGKYPDTRKGCQACISSSKCPAAELVRRIAFNTTTATDQCSSTEEKHGKLPATSLEAIAAVSISETMLRSYDVPSAERAAIATSRERIEAQILTAPRDTREPRRAITMTETKTIRKPVNTPVQSVSASKVSDTTKNHAAATGDLAAALNA